MKVLMFAFSSDDPNHPYRPHRYDENSVVYTGTHDNNTIVGWYTEDADADEKTPPGGVSRRRCPRLTGLAKH